MKQKRKRKGEEIGNSRCKLVDDRCHRQPKPNQTIDVCEKEGVS